MKSAIEQMCFGLRGTYESVRPSEKYFRLIEKVCKADNKLIEKLKDAYVEEKQNICILSEWEVSK